MEAAARICSKLIHEAERGEERNMSYHGSQCVVD